MEFVDSHCHLHDKKYDFDRQNYVKEAVNAGVNTMVCVGTDAIDSANAINFVKKYPKNLWATVGIHPHEAKMGQKSFKKLVNLVKDPKVIAVGECGLDYFYEHSDKKAQKEVLEFQIELAKEHKLPLVFHVRDAYDDFWQIIDKYNDLTGVFHCFSANTDVLKKVLNRGFYVGVNGITTFAKDKKQLEAFKAIPLEKMLLETDAPYLTPSPYRGTINASKHVVTVARFLSELRREPIDLVAQKTTSNFNNLFGIK